jgi:fumarate hydratase subunit alpha
MNRIRVVRTSEITRAVADLYRQINTHLRPDVKAALERAREREDNELARDVLGALLENERISAAEGLPLCQDTGLAVAFIRMGQNVVLRGGSLREAVDEGIRRAAGTGPLRASTVGHPLERDNVGDNTPAIVHLESVPGDVVRIHLLAKGGGAENMSRIHMLNPGDGREGVVEAVVETARRAGANA